MQTGPLNTLRESLEYQALANVALNREEVVQKEAVRLWFLLMIAAGQTHYSTTKAPDQFLGLVAAQARFEERHSAVFAQLLRRMPVLARIPLNARKQSFGSDSELVLGRSLVNGFDPRQELDDSVNGVERSVAMVLHRHGSLLGFGIYIGYRG